MIPLSFFAPQLPFGAVPPSDLNYKKVVGSFRQFHNIVFTNKYKITNTKASVQWYKRKKKKLRRNCVGTFLWHKSIENLETMLQMMEIHVIRAKVIWNEMEGIFFRWTGKYFLCQLSSSVPPIFILIIVLPLLKLTTRRSKQRQLNTLHQKICFDFTARMERTTIFVLI